MHNKAEVRSARHRKKILCGERGGPLDLVTISLIPFSTILSGRVQFCIQPSFHGGETWTLKAQSKTPEAIELVRSRIRID